MPRAQKGKPEDILPIKHGGVNGKKNEIIVIGKQAEEAIFALPWDPNDARGRTPYLTVDPKGEVHQIRITTVPLNATKGFRDAKTASWGNNYFRFHRRAQFLRGELAIVYAGAQNASSQSNVTEEDAEPTAEEQEQDATGSGAASVA